MTRSEIRTELYNILHENFSAYKIYMQGSMAKCERYPETFFTYVISENREISFADNQKFQETFTIQVAVYSNSIDNADNVADQLKNILTNNGYVFSFGTDVISDEKTHTGYMQEFIKII